MTFPKLLVFLFLVFSLPAFSQKHTVNGYIQDSITGEKLPGANFVELKTMKGVQTNVYGFFSLTLPSDTVIISASFIGYSPITLKFKLRSDTTITFKLSPAVQLKEVEITTERANQRSSIGAIEIPIDQIKNLPVFMGERDILKIIQLMPGVKSGGEGNSGMYVRGGGPDQNLILLDGVPVYNASHLFGFFSVFNPDAVKSVELVKGGFPARYGGRLSSVLDIRMKEGDMQKIKGEVSIGIISSKLMLEGPIKKDKTSFIISGRRTYIDILAQPLIKLAAAAEGEKLTAGYYFYDLNGKVNHIFSDKSRLFLSAYTGNDKAYARNKNTYNDFNGDEVKEQSKMKLAWGNLTTALRWNYVPSKKLFLNTTLTYSKYRFIVGQESISESPTDKELFSFEYSSGIHDVAGKVDFDYFPTSNHQIKFGAGNIYHTFIPGVNAFKEDYSGAAPFDTTFGAKKIHSHESFVYAEDDFKLGGRLKINVGVHASSFLVKNKTYFSPQPRASANFSLTDNTAIKAGYSSMTQYLHLLTNATIGLPTDLWVPVTDTIKPQFSSQYAIGVAHALPKNIDLTIEGYYKDMLNLIEYKEGASFFSSSTDWQQKVEFGNGWSYGAEVLLQKKSGKFNGWVGYTLSWTYRQFDNLNFGKKYFYKYDRRHDIGIALNYKLNEKWDFGLVWVYGTGNAITLPTVSYASNYDYRDNYFLGYNTNTVDNFKERNNFRMPSYNRLDVGATRHKKKSYGEVSWSYGLYNAYNRQNPFYLYFENTFGGNKKLTQISLFPIIPSVSWTLKF